VISGFRREVADNWVITQPVVVISY
jgi:hypothetical protein